MTLLPFIVTQVPSFRYPISSYVSGFFHEPSFFLCYDLWIYIFRGVHNGHSTLYISRVFSGESLMVTRPSNSTSYLSFLACLGLVVVFLHHLVTNLYSRLLAGKYFFWRFATCYSLEGFQKALFVPPPMAHGPPFWSGIAAYSFGGWWRNSFASSCPLGLAAGRLPHPPNWRPNSGQACAHRSPSTTVAAFLAYTSGWISPFRAPFRGIQSRSGTLGWVLRLHIGSLPDSP